MIEKLKYCIVILLAGTLLLGPHALAAGANDPIFGACQGKAAASPACKGKNTTENPVVNIISTAINILAVVGGVIAVIMIIISGFRFVIAGGTGFKNGGGSPTAVAKARATLLYSIVGLVVIALSWTIIRFITDKVLQ